MRQWVFFRPFVFFLHLFVSPIRLSRCERQKKMLYFPLFLENSRKPFSAVLEKLGNGGKNSFFFGKLITIFLSFFKKIYILPFTPAPSYAHQFIFVYNLLIHRCALFLLSAIRRALLYSQKRVINISIDLKTAINYYMKKS